MEDNINVIVVGITGVGKSSFCRYLSNITKLINGKFKCVTTFEKNYD